MLRQAGRIVAQQGVRAISTSTAAAAEGSSISTLVNAVKSSSASTFTSGGLNSLKAAITPNYGAAADAASSGLSTQAKLVLGAAAGWFLFRADTQARSKDWIVDLSLDVLQAAWIISYLSFVPFRSVFFALRGIAPHTATPLAAARPAFYLK